MPRGGARSGAGRKAKDCPGELLYTYSFRIRLEDTGVLNRLGHGNLSLGLRRLIDCQWPIRSIHWWPQKVSTRWAVFYIGAPPGRGRERASRMRKESPSVTTVTA